MTSNSNSHRTVIPGPRSKCDQVVFEALAKAAEIVVASRCWLGANSAAGSSNSRSGNLGRFNLLVPEVPSVRYVLRSFYLFLFFFFCSILLCSVEFVHR